MQIKIKKPMELDVGDLFLIADVNGICQCTANTKCEEDLPDCCAITCQIVENPSEFTQESFLDDWHEKYHNRQLSGVIYRRHDEPVVCILANLVNATER